MRLAAHQDMDAAASPRWQQRGDAGQPRRAKVLIQPVHDQQQGTVFGFGSPGRALPERPVLMRVRDRGVFLQQVGQLRDHGGEEPRAVCIGFAARQEIADDIALVSHHRHRLRQQ